MDSSLFFRVSSVRNLTSVTEACQNGYRLSAIGPARCQLSFVNYQLPNCPTLKRVLYFTDPPFPVLRSPRNGLDFLVPPVRTLPYADKYFGSFPHAFGA